MMGELAALVGQAVPVVGAVVGLYMAIKVDIAKLAAAIEHISKDCARIDKEITRLNDAAQRIKGFQQ